MTVAQIDTTAAPELSDAQKAQQLYHASVRTGLAMSGADLGKAFGKSDRWGRLQIEAARGGGDSTEVASPVVVSFPTAGSNLETDASATTSGGNATSADASAGTRGASAPEAAAAWWRSVLANLPLYLISLAAFVSIWGGWVGLGELTGFGPIRLFPGLSDFVLNTAITLPIGVEAYAAYALKVAISPPPGLSTFGRRFASWSAGGALLLGAAGQVAYHVMVESGVTAAPWQITTFVSCLPVIVMGAAAALHHLVKAATGDAR